MRTSKRKQKIVAKKDSGAEVAELVKRFNRTRNQSFVVQRQIEGLRKQYQALVEVEKSNRVDIRKAARTEAELRVKFLDAKMKHERNHTRHGHLDHQLTEVRGAKNELEKQLKIQNQECRHANTLLLALREKHDTMDNEVRSMCIKIEEVVGRKKALQSQTAQNAEEIEVHRETLVKLEDELLAVQSMLKDSLAS